MTGADFNYESLTPTAFLRRAARVYGDRIGVVDGDVRFSYAQFLQRTLKFAGALKGLGVAPGDRVALLAGNSHVMLAAHYAVPFAGAALVALNTRITPADTGYILQHSGSSVLIYDTEFAAAAQQAAADIGSGIRLICAGGADDELEALIDAAPAFSLPVTDERGLLAINYTSGTTARPKGVMYHHRGAYLQSLAMALHMGVDRDSVFLWTLPMFHCNGWCFSWAVTAVGGVHLCLPRLEAEPDLAAHARVRRHPFLRRADGADDDDLGSGGRQGQAAAPGAHRHRRRAADARIARTAGRTRHGHHAPVWPDRNLWPVRGLRVAQRLEDAERFPSRRDSSRGRVWAT